MMRILIGRPATASMTSSTITMIIAVPRSGCSSTSTIGMPDMMSRRKTSRQARPSSSRRGAVRRHRQDQGQDGEFGGLQLQRAETEPARRALGAAPHHEHPQQGQDDQPVQERGQLFETPVVEEGHHHHRDDPEHHEEALLLQEGLGVLPLGQQRATGCGVDHHHPDRGHQQRGDDEDDIERWHAAPRGNVSSGECGHMRDSGTEYRP